MALIKCTKAASGPAPLRIRLPFHVSVRAETPPHASQSAAGKPETTPREFAEEEEARSISRFRPFIRVAAVTAAQPESRIPSPDHYVLRKHLEEQRRPQVVKPPRSDTR